MLKVGHRVKQFGWFASAFSAIILIITGYLKYRFTSNFDDFIFAALLAAVLPPAILEYVDYKWRRGVNEHLPELFRSIVQAQETGMTLPQAIEEASKRNYGPLTTELRKLTAQISWGRTFEEALLAFGKRVNTVLVQRTVPLIIEASRSGGHVEKVFDPLGKFVQTTLLLDKERRNQTKSYIAIIYVAFFVFLFTIILLFNSFFVTVEGSPILGTAAITSMDMRRLFFHMTIIQAFFGGLVAGKMGEGTIVAGLKHCLVMMICGYIALKLFL